ncbi:MAG: pyridoxal phosphate-dependent aminotransferase [Eubacteriales bacterium]|nr:pyridoxal phosphate-dependent aminotransferase [Eubacteriales bacterium]
MMEMVKPISKIASSIAPSTTLAINAMFKQMQADGIDVVGFGAGEPDFDTPENIKAAGIAAIEDNQTRYTPAAGLLSLREAVCTRMKEDLGLDYEPSQVVVASGAKHSVYAAIMVCCDPGDEVIIAAPYWLSYSEMVRMSGAVPIEVIASKEQQFKITAEQLEAAITPKTKMFMLNSPSNPTGMVYTREELEALAAVCEKHGIYVLADDIYYKLVYDGIEYTSIASVSPAMKEQCIIVNGVSKTYAMTGWRVGYTLSNETVAKAMSSYLSHSTGAPATPAQYAAVEALTGPQESVELMRQEFEKRRDHLVERMNKIEGVSCLKPQGAFYVMMDMSGFVGKEMYGHVIEGDADFAQLLLEKGGVATVPTAAFAAPNNLRWSYATSLEQIDKGLDRLEKFIAEA